ncbi:MAG: bifunctional diguanylate cyclase/phosphodiesterase [Bacillota bacterium]
MKDEKTMGIETLKMKNKYTNNPNRNKAFSILMQDMIEFFDVDRIFIGMKSIFENECTPIVEYLKNKKPRVYGEVMDFEGFTKFAAVDISDAEQNYIDLCKKNNYFTADQNEELDAVLSAIGYLPSPLGPPEERLIYSIRNKESFSFLVFGRYEKREQPWSTEEQMYLGDLQDFLSLKVSVWTLESRLYNEMRMKDKIVENENIPICLVETTDNRVIYYNDHYEEQMPNVHLGICYDDLFDNAESTALLSDSIRLQKKSDGTNHYWIKKNVPFDLSDGTEVCMVYTKDTEEYIKEMAGIDLLTSAYSLQGFSELFHHLVNEDIGNHMLCTLDIDKFKYINDQYTFAVGNQLLQQVAKVLESFVRRTEFFCRINEDKFAFALQCDTEEEAQARMNQLFASLEKMQHEHFLEINLIVICGITVLHKDKPLNLLLDQANSARKNAKGSHKSTAAFFDKEAEQKVIQEISISQRVPNAVKNKEFVPFLQPKFNLRTLEICGAEALVRWLTPTGMIFPDQFIPLFEKDGFIDTLDFIIYKQVLIHIRECIDEGLPVYPISLNVSRNHIRNRNFVKQIMDLIEKYDVPIELLELEVTESIFIEDREMLKFFIDNIKRPKIKVSIDDFGSAYSSLQVLKDIDIDILKIDKGFLDNIDFTDSHVYTRDEVVLKNIIQLARDLHCQVICEGVETEGQIELLKSIGCEYGQGYVFAKPMPIDEYKSTFLKK